MSDGLKKFLVDLGLGLLLALLVFWAEGLFGLESAFSADGARILCDGFFVAAALLLAGGGLQWTYNGGVMDGLNYTVKMGIARIKRDYETAKKTFAEYREEREAKSSSPRYMMLSGLCYLVIALALYLIYTKL